MTRVIGPLASALAVPLTALVVLFQLAGCSAERQLPDTVLVVGQQAEPKSLDPHVSTASTDFRIAANLYEGLVRFGDGTLEIVPSLAESWEIADDGLTYTFKLRPDVRFQDGTPLDADAVKFNFERILDPDHPFHDTGPFPLAFFFSSIARIETPDPLTVVFHLKEPFAPLLSNLATPSGFLVSPAGVERWGKDFGRHPVGTGPFRFERWESNRLVQLTKNPDYHGTPARLETVIFEPLTDENTRMTELLSGGCDVILDVAPDVVNWFRTSGRYHVVEAPGANLWFLILNLKEGPFRDHRMRLAANYAINREAIVRDLLQGTATIAVGPIPRAFTWAAAPGLKPYPYDPDKAQKLIREAGYENAELVLYATEGGSGMLAPKEMAAAIQANLAAVGLRVKIESFEWNTFLARVNEGLNGKADMAEMAWMVNDPDTLPFLTLRTAAWPDKGGFNSGYYSNPEVDKLLNEARRTPDQALRGELYRRVDRLVHDDAPWVAIASGLQTAVTTKRVRDFRLQPSYQLLLHDVWKENGP